jgi:hypothetical protein
MDWPERWENLLINLAAAGILALGSGSLACIRRCRTNVYLPLVLTNNPKSIEEVEAKTACYFQPWFFWQIPRLTEPARDRSAMVDTLDRAKWIELLNVAAKTIRKTNKAPSRGRSETLHLVPRVPTLWGFALGMKMNNQYPVVVYHWQQEGNRHCYRIWRCNRDIKNLRGPKANRKFEYRVFKQGEVAPSVQGGPATAECLVFRMGANELLSDVCRYRETHLPQAEMRVFTKVSTLVPTQRYAWVRAAAEMAHAICDQQGRPRDVYLFTDLPTTLALMAGDSIGPYTSRRVHLMQWDAKESTYHEMLCVPEDLESIDT